MENTRIHRIQELCAQAEKCLLVSSEKVSEFENDQVEEEAQGDMKIPFEEKMGAINVLQEKGLDPEGAIALYSKAIYLDGESTKLYVLRGDVFLQLGEFKTALTNYRHALQLQPEYTPLKQKTAEVLDMLGMIYFEDGELAKAMACLDEALELDKRQGSYWMHRTLLHLENGHINKALQNLDQYMQLVHDDVDAYILRGKILWKLNMSDKATSDFKMAKRLCPGHVEVSKFDNLLVLEAQSENASASKKILLGDYIGAMRMLNKALKVTPKDTRLLLLATTASRQLGKLRDALGFVETALVCNAEQRNAGTTTAMTLLELKQLNKEKALILNDQAVLMLHHASKDHRSYDNVIDQVLEQLEEAKSLWPAGSVIHVHIGDCFRMKKDYQTASFFYSEAKRLDPSETEEVNKRIALIECYLGQQLFNQGAYLDAERKFSIAIEHDPTQAEYYSERGLAKACAKNLSQAYADFKHALQLDPNNARAKSWLAAYNVGGNAQDTKIIPLRKTGKSHQGPASGALLPRT